MLSLICSDHTVAMPITGMRETPMMYALPQPGPHESGHTYAAMPGSHVQPRANAVRHILPVGAVHLAYGREDLCVNVTPHGVVTGHGKFGPFAVFDLMPVPATGDPAIFQLVSASGALVRIQNTLGERAPYVDAVTRDPEDPLTLLRLKPADGGFKIESALHEV
jgi:hypothetical protein